MGWKWDKYSRMGLDVASTATLLGFSAAKAGTKLGFSITRGVASTAAGITGSAVDHAFFGGAAGAGQMLGGAVSTALTTVESLALAPILIGESITSTTLVAAHSSLYGLATIFPGSDEASFSLASFVQLVRREWSAPAESDGLPEERYGVTKIARALMSWATLQGVTSEYQERRWLQLLREIPVRDESQTTSKSQEIHDLPRESKSSEVHVVSDVVYPSQGGQVVTADIGEALGGTQSPTGSGAASVDLSGAAEMQALKQTLRRLSKLVLAGYGGPSLLFFGVSPWPDNVAVNGPSDQKRKEEASLERAVNASEDETHISQGILPEATADSSQPIPGKSSYSWWNVLMGRHDHDIFMNYATSHPPGLSDGSESAHSTAGPSSPQSATAFVGSGNLMPRFWVLTDHARREVVLVVRGTVSLNELAVDLTCDPVPFDLHFAAPPPSKSKDKGKMRDPNPADEEADTVWNEFHEELENIPGSFPVDISTPAPPRKRQQVERTPSLMQDKMSGQGRCEKDSETVTHLVHGGMLKMAQVMGTPGKPVHVAVRNALKRNHGYSLVLCGHSLGAGVAGLLALMWSNPYTRLTHQHSGLPRRRTVSAYLLGPPCLTSPALGKIAADSGLIVSFVNSTDIVSRLSLGSVRDLTRCATWLCKAEDEHGEGYSKVTKRALQWKAGHGEEGYDEWFLAMRKTLEANMHMTQLFPPGRVLWAMRDGNLHPAHRLRGLNGRLKNADAESKARLFEVFNVQHAFDQIVFARDMLSSHMPHQYDRVLNDIR